jgi:histidine triad (HIT) family protein
MSECVFCERIEKGEYDYGDYYSVAFRPLKPVTENHWLVVPMLHVADAMTAPQVTGSTFQFASVLAHELKLGSCNLITSAGIPATQSIFHFHVHVVPRQAEDGLKLPWTGQE